MRLSIAAASLAVLASSAQAFKDTSPFLMFSNSPLPESMKDVSQSQLQSAAAVLQSTKDFLATCPSEIYYIISQPSVSSDEVAKSMTHLKMAVGNPAVKTRMTVSEVAGLRTEDAEGLMKYIEEKCGSTRVENPNDIFTQLKASGEKRNVVSRQKSEEPGTGEIQRVEMLSDVDSYLYGSVLEGLPKGYKYTVIYITTQFRNTENHKFVNYMPNFQEDSHMELKRDFSSNKKENDTESDLRPLFEKYNFFNPGLFMGLSVSLLLLAILSVGISAVSSLEVSYGAFEKEMGPAAQKKL